MRYFAARGTADQVKGVSRTGGSRLSARAGAPPANSASSEMAMKRRAVAVMSTVLGSAGDDTVGIVAPVQILEGSPAGGLVRPVPDAPEESRATRSFLPLAGPPPARSFP